MTTWHRWSEAVSLTAFTTSYRVLSVRKKGSTEKKSGLMELVQRARGDVDEIILATSSSLEGETTATYITKLLKPSGIKITKLATGIPVGADFNVLDSSTLTKAYQGRQDA